MDGIDLERMRRNNSNSGAGNLRDVWRNGTHYNGCEYNHYCCAVNALCDEVERLRGLVSPEAPKINGWIGVDLDGTLATANDWTKSCGIGEPVPAMVDRVKDWLDEGRDVRIFTARVAVTGEFSPISNRFADEAFRDEQILMIEEWCDRHIGRVLPITSEKDFRMTEMWDDRAVQVVRDTGQRLEDYLFEHPTRGDDDE